jgi:hypothetical protein
VLGEIKFLSKWDHCKFLDGRWNIVQIAILPNLMSRFKINYMRIPPEFLMKLQREMDSKIHMEIHED